MAHIYLASPYTHADKAQRELRHEKAAQMAARLMERGWIVFSPIVHARTIAYFLEPERELDHTFWMRQARGMLRTASYLFVLKLEGWGVSRGVSEEILCAEENSIPVRYLEDHAELPSVMKLARAVA